jgi:hypothetical protein
MTLSAPQILGSPSAIAGKSFVTFAMLDPSLPLPIQKLNYAGCIRSVALHVKPDKTPELKGETFTA